MKMSVPVKRYDLQLGGLQCRVDRLLDLRLARGAQPTDGPRGRVGRGEARLEQPHAGDERVGGRRHRADGV
ncbi:hypothetical protein [Trebonia kvetii]|uniref:hypothetical protein n=1 Tax=Trebonia kvetii TaxID=2480626 RepID=UPI001651F41F|nr:hypothetical protein [Trebonia kvetii]